MNETPLGKAWRLTYPWLVTAVTLVLLILVVGLALGRARPRGDVPGKPLRATEVTAPGFGLPSTLAPSPVTSASLSVTGDCRAAVDSLVTWVLGDGTPPAHVPDACTYLSASQYHVVWREALRDVARGEGTSG